MHSKTLALALALTSMVSATPLIKRQDPCRDTYNSCVAAGVPDVACTCDLQACVGEDNARGREFCASATATIVRSTAASKPTTMPSMSQTKTVIYTPTPCPETTSSVKPAPTGAAVPAGSNPVKTDKTWSVNNLSRYCLDNTGCDYNFVIEANGKTERCTVIRQPGKDAATESWSNQPCGNGSPFTISWGYSPQPAPAFAVMTVVNGKELAWFGVPDINGQKVTPSNPFGSGQYPSSTSPVYTYN